MTIKALYPNIEPSLNLSFALTKALDPRITFARASTARYYNGVTTAKAEENLLLQSQDFTTTWSTTSANATITANTTAAPDGTTTADSLTATASTGAHLVFQTITASSGNTRVLSVFVKKDTHDFIQLSFNGYTSHFVNFNIDTGVVGDVNGAGSSASIVNVGNGWYRCVYVYPSATESQIRIALVPSNTATRVESWTALGTETVFLWGAQLEQRSAVTAYTPTTTQPITNYVPVLLSAANNVARFDHNPVTGESLGLLIEEQRTNLLTYSEAFDDAIWGATSVTVGVNAAVAPSGTITADSLTEIAGTSLIPRLSWSQTISTSTQYTLTVYAKEIVGPNRRYLQIWINSGFPTAGGSQGANFDLVSGTVTKNVGNFTASMTPVGNGWYRCVLITNTSNGTTAGIRIGLQDSPTADPATFWNPTGTGSSILLWGAQLEAGAFPTSYIPTVASAVTRSADAASMTGANFSSWYRADEGTLYAESTLSGNAINKDLVFISDNTSSNSIAIRWASGAQAQFSVTVGGASQSNIAPSGFSTVGVSYKRAAAYQVNNFEQAINGASVGTDTSGTVPIVDRLYFGSTSGGVNLCGTVKKLAYYPKRLANAELQALTQI
jgi:hypothetical protein